MGFFDEDTNLKINKSAEHKKRIILPKIHVSSKQKKFLSSFIGLLIVIIGVIVFNFIRAKNLTAAWFDDNWLYRKAISVTVSSSTSDITNLETLITVDTTGITDKLQTNCEDVRFTNQNGKRLNYYIDSCNDNSASNKIWVMVDLVPKNTTAYTVYMYYGNPTASSESDGTLFSQVRGLVAYWAMNESSATTANDTSVKANTATDSSTSSTSSGKYSNARVFNGTTSYIARTSSLNGIPDINAAQTLTAWINLNSASGSKDIVVPVLTGSAANQLRVNGSTLEVSRWAGGTNITSSTTLSTGTWYFVAWTWDGTTNRLFINGVQDAVSTTVPQSGTPTAVAIGAYGAGAGLETFNGTLDDVRIYSRALTPAEIAQQYENPGQFAYYTTSSTSPTTVFSSEEKGTGPVLFWRFDDATGTSAQDSTANNYNGTISGTNSPVWQTDDQCVLGKCLYFNGSNQSNNGQVLRTQASTDATVISGDMTVSAWIRPTSNYVDTAGYFVRNGQGTDLMYTVYYDYTNNRIGFQWYDGSFKTVTSPNNSVPINQWSFVTAVRTGSTIRLYANGRQLTSSATATTPTGTATDLTVGRTTLTNQDYTGFIDEVKIYNYARSADQIKLDYNNSGINEGAGTRLSNPPENYYQALNQGLVGYWKMDETSGNRSDSSGNGYTLTDGNTVTSNPGKFNYAGQFTRANAEYLSITEAAAPQLSVSSTQSFTVSAWVYADSLAAGDKVPVAKSEVSAGPSREYYFVMNSGTVHWAISTDGGSPGVYCDLIWSGTMAASTWYHLTGWYDATTQTAGFEVNNADTTTASCAGPYDGNAPFRIGSASINQAPISAWDGRIDEVRVYRRALSSAERAALYNFAPKPNAYWQFEEASGSRVDSVGGLSLSQANDSLPSSPGIAGKAVYFPNTANQYLYLTDNSTLSAGNIDFSVGAWVRLVNKNDDRSIVFKGTAATTGGMEYSLKYSTVSDRFQWIISNGSTITTLSANALGSPSANKWYYVFGWYDSQNDITGISINGSYVSTASNSTGSQDTAGAFNVGASNGTIHMFGKIDEVKFYRYVRTSKQIIEDMNFGHPAVGTPISSPVAQWKFDEGYGTTAYDSTIQSNNLTLANFASPSTGNSGWSNQGKFGKALVFDHSNDYLYISDNASFQPTYLSISAWIKQGQTAADAIVVDKPYGSSCFRSFALGANNGAALMTITDGSTTRYNAEDPSGNPTNVWQHWVGTYDGSYVRLYVNGVKKAETAASISIPYSSTNLLVGAASCAGTSTPNTGWWQGLIDDVKIYDYALTDDQVKLEYNRGQAVTYGVLGTSISDGKTASDSAATAYCIPGDTSSCASPIGHWTMEEHRDDTCTGGTADVCDITGNENNGTKTSGTATTWVPGKIGGGLHFNGSANEVTVNDTPFDFERTDSFTLEAWVKTTKLNGSIIMIKQDATPRGISFFYEDGSGFVRVFIQSTSSNRIRVLGNISILDGRWHHVAVSYDGSSSATGVKIYTDGILNTNTVQENTLTTTILNNSNLKFGCASTCITSDAWDGDFDDFRVYNYVRTPAQIAYEYNQGRPVGYWKFDECQGIIVNDSSGRDQSGTIFVGSGGVTSVGNCNTSSTMWGNGASEKYNYSLDFDGTDDYIRIGDYGALQPSVGQGFTITAWAKATDWVDAGPQMIVAKWDTNVDGAYYLGVFQNKARGLMNGNSGSGGVAKSTNSNTDLVNGAWAHLAMTWSGVGTDPILLYVNGKLDSVTSSNETFASIADISEPTLMGARKSSAPEALFDGQIDEVKIFNYALTPIQIRNDFNQGSAIRYGPNSGAP